MTIDDLINNALKGQGGILDAAPFFALVGDADTQELFVLNLQEFFVDNLEHFRVGERTGAILVGAYATEQAARDAMATIREEKPYGTDLLISAQWHMLIGNVEENKLFAITLKDYYVGYLGFFLFKVNTANVALSIFDSKEAAEDAIDLIRYSIRDENDS